MSGLRFGLAAAGLLLVVAQIFSISNTGHMALLCFAGLFLTCMGRVSRLAATIGALTALAIGFDAIARGPLALDPSSGTFIFAFLLSSGMLRTIAGADPAILGLASRLARAPDRLRYGIISLGSMLLSFVLLVGALQFLAGVFSSRSSESRSAILPTMQAALVGFAVNPILSPVAVPFLVVSSLLPGINWSGLLPILAGCAVSVWLSGVLQQRLAPAAVTSEPDTTALPPSAPASLAAVLVLTPVVLAGLIYMMLDIRLAAAALLGILLSSVGWALLRLQRIDLITSGTVTAINEATVIGGSILIGLVFIANMPTGWTAAAASVLLDARVFAPLIILGFFVLGGQIGLQPSICFLLLMPVLAAYLGYTGDRSDALMASVIVGWSLNSVLSPFGVPVLIVSQVAGLGSASFVWRHTAVFAVVSSTLCAIVILSANG